MALAYDEYDKRSNTWSPNLFVRCWKSILKTLRIDNSDFDVFECAGAIWAGYIDGAVDPNPMCSKCNTQLSFISKDIMVCDYCHKYSNKNNGNDYEGFKFVMDSRTLTYQSAYIFAKKKWRQILADEETGYLQ